jgi:hypothetical protein
VRNIVRRQGGLLFTEALLLLIFRATETYLILRYFIIFSTKISQCVIQGIRMRARRWNEQLVVTVNIG